MVGFLDIITFLLLTATTAVAAPAPQVYARQSQAEQFYYLRTVAHGEPWDGRWLVTLPTLHQIGLENFTIHPPSPPIKLQPVHLTNGTYALRGEASGDDPTKTPYLAALKSKAGTRTVMVAFLSLSNSTDDSFNDDPEACPDGYECFADQWTFNEVGEGGVFPNLRFAGFKGRWEPFKDAAPYGWHVYWKGPSGLHHSVQFDLVPLGSELKAPSGEMVCGK